MDRHYIQRLYITISNSACLTKQQCGHSFAACIARCEDSGASLSVFGTETILLTCLLSCIYSILEFDAQKATARLRIMYKAKVHIVPHLVRS